MINEKKWLWAGWVAPYLQISLSAQVNGGSRCHHWPLKTAIFCGQGLRRLPWIVERSSDRASTGMCVPQWMPSSSHYTCRAVQSGFRESFSWLSIILLKRHKIEVLLPVVSITKEFNLRLAKRQMKTNGRLANHELINLLKKPTGVLC